MSWRGTSAEEPRSVGFGTAEGAKSAEERRVRRVTDYFKLLAPNFKLRHRRRRLNHFGFEVAGFVDFEPVA